MNTLSDNQSRRILVIDDNHAIHEDFRKILGGNRADRKALEEAEAALFGAEQAKPSPSGFELDSAFQGKQGLERVQQALENGYPYSVAFVDVRMPPGWDGIETTAKIWEVDPDLQVVICTAYSDYSWDDMIARIGQSDRLVILKKPFDNVEVLQLANALAEKWRLLQQAKTRIGDLEKAVNARTAELHKSEEGFRLITENAADLISIVDLKGQCVYHSPAYARGLGYLAEEFQKDPGLPPIHPEDQQRFITAIRSALQTGIGQSLEYRMQHKDGSWRAFESRESVIRNGEGQIESLVMVARDVTGRKAAERDRQMMEMQLRQAQKLESIGQLAAGIAHEINTPTQYIGDNTRFLQDAFKDLTHLLGQHEKLLQAAKANAVTAEVMAAVEEARQRADADYLAGEIPKAIQQSLDGVERVSKIVRSMKEFSHPGSEDKTALDLNRAIESTITVAGNEWKYVAEVVTDFDSTLPCVPCLPGEFNQVILNLIINATHAIADVVGDGSKGKGRISISTRHCENWAEIRIGDTGGGIPEKIRERVFEPFFTTKPVGKGTGQGLAIAHSVVVEKHAGTLSFETEAGKGTTFIIRLPLAPPAAAERKAA